MFLGDNQKRDSLTPDVVQPWTLLTLVFPNADSGGDAWLYLHGRGRPWPSLPNYCVGVCVAPASRAGRTEVMRYVIFMVPVKFTE